MLRSSAGPCRATVQKRTCVHRRIVRGTPPIIPCVSCFRYCFVISRFISWACVCVCELQHYGRSIVVGRRVRVLCPTVVEYTCPARCGGCSGHVQALFSAPGIVYRIMHAEKRGKGDPFLCYPRIRSVAVLQLNMLPSSCGEGGSLAHQPVATLDATPSRLKPLAVPLYKYQSIVRVVSSSGSGPRVGW